MTVREEAYRREMKLNENAGKRRVRFAEKHHIHLINWFQL